MTPPPTKLLTTKQLPAITGLSQSFFEKGRIYGYGPQFIRIKSGRRAGKVLYRPGRCRGLAGLASA